MIPQVGFKIVMHIMKRIIGYKEELPEKFIMVSSLLWSSSVRHQLNYGKELGKKALAMKEQYQKS